MGGNSKHSYSSALAVAKTLTELLLPMSQEIAIVGSLRRKRTLIGDVELLIIPKWSTNLMDEPDKTVPTALDVYIQNRYKLIKGGGVFKGNGRDRLKRFMYDAAGFEIQVDLWLQDENTWGVNKMIRTGNETFSKFMVSKAAARAGVRFKNARVVPYGRQPLDTPTERSVFEALGVPYIDPQRRNDKAVAQIRSKLGMS